ncbi:hypothetical protein D3N24_20775 [Vibrio vulnificus]|uniref:hypothetical protein n=1 Tax=Vibrio vulnificus TaxID=672 RepID=UPI0002E292EE|nr:hypothetical protein [Vibrio vulnificus]EGQ8085941.1 hypothetical protein [Vibrio vulnificus]EGR1869847.1 hypothetical protein [Vibrio vulnificus]EHZ7344689.1 hypothetical protein [Vibrio vulnificus]EID4335025.1 hypothetical protein [Vibrio vulnificus]EJC6742972.1 hypothetical protein [Vibrio vulnificus]
MKVQIVLSSGSNPLYLQYVSKGHVVTTYKPNMAITLPESTARQLLTKVQSRWPMAQLSYSLGA